MYVCYGHGWTWTPTSMDIKPGEAVAFVSAAAAPAAIAVLPAAIAVVPAFAPVAGFVATTAAIGSL